MLLIRRWPTRSPRNRRTDHARTARAARWLQPYAGDAPGHISYEGIKGVSITLNYATIADAEASFAALAEGGRVTMPMQEAFWAKRWGMLDRFGTPWIVDGELMPI